VSQIRARAAGIAQQGYFMGMDNRAMEMQLSGDVYGAQRQRIEAERQKQLMQSPTIGGFQILAPLINAAAKLQNRALDRDIKMNTAAITGQASVARAEYAGNPLAALEAQVSAEEAWIASQPPEMRAALRARMNVNADIARGAAGARNARIDSDLAFRNTALDRAGARNFMGVQSAALTSGIMQEYLSFVGGRALNPESEDFGRALGILQTGLRTQKQFEQDYMHGFRGQEFDLRNIAISPNDAESPTKVLQAIEEDIGRIEQAISNLVSN
jgi:hypothetical protein